MGSRAVTILLVLLAGGPAAAQQPGPPPGVSQGGGLAQPVQLQFQEGRVTLRAQNAPVRAILAEWARLGGATIVNAERVAGPPVTLELTGIPERQALDIVLRNVAGYMLAPRRAGGSGASTFDRILILPTSVAPRNPPPAPAAAGARPVPALPRPPVIARPPETIPIEAPLEVPLPEDFGDADAQGDEPVTTGPPRVIPQPLVRPPVAMPPGVGPELVPEQQPENGDAPPAAPPAAAPTPTNPFGIPSGSSAIPGVIAPAPRPQPQTTAPNRVQ